MKTKTFQFMILAILLVPHWSFSQNQVPVISILSASMDTCNQIVGVVFDLHDAEGDTMEVWIQASVDGGKTWVVPVVPDSLSGDWGPGQLSGNGKSISWSYDQSVLGQYSNGSPTLRIRVIADDHAMIPVTEVVNKVDSARVVANLLQFEGIRNRVTNPLFLKQIKDSLKSIFKSSGVYYYRQGPLYNGYQIDNVIGFSSGTRTPSNSWSVSGHFDTVSNTPGADDNATGMAGVAEAIRVLSEYQTRNSIRYFFFDLEELRIDLSGAYKYTQTGIPFWENMQGLFNLDCLGNYSDSENSQTFPNGFELLFPAQISTVAADSYRANFIVSIVNTASLELDSAFREAAKSFVPDLKVISFDTPGTGTSIPDFRRSDHAPFWDIGVPAVFITDVIDFRDSCYHKPCDTFKRLDMGFLLKNIRAIVATLAQLAVLEHSGCQESDDLEIIAMATNRDVAYTNSIRVFPNPSDGSQTFRVTLNKPGMVGLRVMDIKGRIVDKTPAAWYPAGISIISYPKELDNGSYQVILELNGVSYGSDRLIVIRN